MKSKFIILFLMLSIKVPVIFAQTPPLPPNASSLETADTETESGLISVGDILDVRVLNHPQLSRENIKVDDRGEIKMPFLEKTIPAACISERALADEITTRYQEILRNPQVEVILKEYRSQPFAAVIGSVRSPSRLQLQRGRQIRLLEALASVGGPTERAGKSIQVIHTGRVETCNSTTGAASDEDAAGAAPSFYDLKSTIDGENAANPYIRSGDIVILPEADQIFVVGNVVKPSTLLLQEPITITKAIAMAGGTMPDTDREKIRIVRQQAGSNTKTEIIINLKDIEKRKAEDITLQANDVLEVPVNGGKRLLKTFVGAVVPSIAQLPVRVIP